MRSAVLCGVIGVAFPGILLAGQSVPHRQLGAVTGTTNTEFTRIAGVRELSDGRVLVADAGSAQLFVVDFAAAASTTVGRNGSGPGEYRSVSSLFASGTDLTVMLDAGTRRWVLFKGDSIESTMPPPSWAARGGLLAGADMGGRYLSIMHGQVATDSIVVLLLDPKAKHVDTLTRLGPAPAAVIMDQDATGKIAQYIHWRPLLAVGEEVQLYPDGWLAVARLEPYRVDWRTPDGTWVLGGALPFSRQPVDAAERRAQLARMERERGRTVPRELQSNWLSHLPPFQLAPLIALPDGRLAIRRIPTARDPRNRYDIVNRRGKLDESVELPPREHIVGVGKRGAYVAHTDEDGIQKLKRVSW